MKRTQTEKGRRLADLPARAPRGRARRSVLSASLVGLLLILAAAVAADASAAPPPMVWQTPENAVLGSGAGQIKFPWGVAADPETGHVFVADAGNARVEEFSVWGEFIMSWGWGVRDGSPELQVCGPGAIPPSATCQEGLAGSGPGQFAGFIEGGIAVDDTGNVYVGDLENHRIEKFGPGGNFEEMFGGDVDKGPNHPGNVCTAAFIAEGDTCGAATAGSGPGQFAAGAFGFDLATDSLGHLFVGDVERIQEFDGGFVGEVKVPGETVSALAIDGAGNFYAAYEEKNGVHKLSPTGSVLSSEFKVLHPQAVAVDGVGNVYAIAQPGVMGLGERSHPVEFKADGTSLIPDEVEEQECEEKIHQAAACEFFAEAGGSEGTSDAQIKGIAVSSACGLSSADFYIPVVDQKGEVIPLGDQESYLRAYGPEPDANICSRAAAEPQITAQLVLSNSPEQVVLGGKINPRGFADTSYYVEYGVGRCSEGECTSETPAPPGKPLGVAGTSPVTIEGLQLTGLQPGTQYHFRLVAESSGSKGEPVRGVGGKVGADGTEATFTTPVLPPLPSRDQCPNAAFRADPVSPATYLADCRAYEMVSPTDTNGGGVFTLLNTVGQPAGYSQSSLDGDALTYSAFPSFAGAQSASYATQYLARRGTSGWSTQAISPPIGIIITPEVLLESEFLAFTPELCESWLFHPSEPRLAGGAVEAYPNLYSRQNCGEEGYLSLTTERPSNKGPESYLPELQGVSADGSVAAFRVEAKLTKNAASTSAYQCYEATGGKLRLVSVLPDGATSEADCSIGAAGHGGNFYEVDDASVNNAVSADGSRIFWTASTAGRGGGAGQIYLRTEHKNPTVAVSAGGEALSGKSDALFWAAAADGSKAIYSVGSLEEGQADLYEFDVARGTTKRIAGEVKGQLGASSNASRLYFVSKEVLGGQNAEGKSATSGDPNLYLYESQNGQFSFVATLSSSDAVSERQEANASPVDIHPYKHLAWVNPDGGATAFMSTAQLTGFANTDANSGKSDAEVFLYSADNGKLLCVSCNPTHVAPSGRELLVRDGGSGTWAAAQIPAAENQFYAPRVLSTDGRRLFFESYEALVPEDVNGKQDVYEWEAPGEGTCSEGSSTYSQLNQGCISLISSGQSTEDAALVDSSPDGSDVFFNTESSLVSGDEGLRDIYDARVDGGFPAKLKPTVCAGEGCQASSPPPVISSPSSDRVVPGNPKPRGCSKGKYKAKKHGKTVCVSTKSGKRHKKQPHPKKRSDHRRRSSR